MTRNDIHSIKNQFTWPISKKLLFAILDDKVSDLFVCELVWERLFYIKKSSMTKWKSSSLTPSYWAEKFIEAPQIISERPPSVHLTRSIPQDHKQDLKTFLVLRVIRLTNFIPEELEELLQ